MSLHRSDATHPYTQEVQLGDRCYESLYVLVLLERGFGFHRHGRNITFALEVKGSEVEWTLGYALSLFNTKPSIVEVPPTDLVLETTIITDVEKSDLSSINFEAASTVL